MPLQVTAIMIGVDDMAAPTRSTGEGLSCAIDQVEDRVGLIVSKLS